jgi:hypothetical protein
MAERCWICCPPCATLAVPPLRGAVPGAVAGAALDERLAAAVRCAAGLGALAELAAAVEALRGVPAGLTAAFCTVEGAACVDCVGCSTFFAVARARVGATGACPFASVESDDLFMKKTPSFKKFSSQPHNKDCPFPLDAGRRQALVGAVPGMLEETARFGVGHYFIAVAPQTVPKLPSERGAVPLLRVEQW